MAMDETFVSVKWDGSEYECHVWYAGAGDGVSSPGGMEVGIIRADEVDYQGIVESDVERDGLAESSELETAIIEALACDVHEASRLETMW